MANETVTAAAIEAEIQADPRFAGSEDRCQLLEGLAQWYERVDSVASEQGAPQLACAVRPGGSMMWSSLALPDVVLLLMAAALVVPPLLARLQRDAWDDPDNPFNRRRDLADGE